MLEREILRAFGNAVFDFEETLYQKYLLLSAKGSLITKDVFQRQLHEMQKKGYVSQANLHGKKGWKREIGEHDLDDEPSLWDISKEKPIQDFIRARYSLKEATESKVVSKSVKLADEIIKIMDNLLLTEYSGETKANREMMHHTRQMRKALSKSRREFIAYLNRNIPQLTTPMANLLDEEGEDLLLLGLHVIETKYATLLEQ